VRDVYASVDSLLGVEAPFVNIHWRAHRRSRLAIIAPHAGWIEPETGELAVAIAGKDHRIYCFSGRDRSNNSRLHVTSTRFNERFLDEVLRDVLAIVTVHGCRHPCDARTLIGGRNRALRRRLAAALTAAGFAVDRAKAPLAGRHPRNLTNRAHAGGVQLELSRSQRDDLRLERTRNHEECASRCLCDFCRYVGAVRLALSQYAATSVTGGIGLRSA
jgi:phage replication-related protein YjqB (UPF0714/DUF867 family)